MFRFQLSFSIYFKKMVMVLTCNEVGLSIFIQAFSDCAMVVVPKGKDDIRICINKKHPNEAIQREHFPLPVIDTFLNKLRGCKFFSRISISARTSAYHHVKLHPDSKIVTTFMISMRLMQSE